LFNNFFQKSRLKNKSPGVSISGFTVCIFCCCHALVISPLLLQMITTTRFQLCFYYILLLCCCKREREMKIIKRIFILKSIARQQQHRPTSGIYEYIYLLWLEGRILFLSSPSLVGGGGRRATHSKSKPNSIGGRMTQEEDAHFCCQLFLSLSLSQFRGVLVKSSLNYVHIYNMHNL
jgi:hypothetical protein